MVETGATGRPFPGWEDVAEDITPDVDDTRDLGAADKRWAYLYAVIAVLTSMTLGGIYLGATTEGWLFVNASTEINGSLEVDVNISAINITASGYYFGNGSQLTDILVTETDPLAYNGTLYLSSNPFSFYNSTDFSIADYYLKNNPFGYYNSSDFSIADYYLKNNPFGYYNSTNPQTETDPKWTANSTLVPYLASANIFTANQNLTAVNITAIDCIIFDSGGKVSSGV